MCWGTGDPTGRDWGVRQEVVRPIHFGVYNIWNVCNGWLDSTLQVMSQANVDLGLFQENKVTKRIYTREYNWYKLVAFDGKSAHSGGGAVSCCMEKQFSVEALHIYCTNIVSFHLASGSQQWYITGFYLAPDNASTIEDVVAPNN